MVGLQLGIIKAQHNYCEPITNQFGMRPTLVNCGYVRMFYFSSNRINTEHGVTSGAVARSGFVNTFLINLRYIFDCSLKHRTPASTGRQEVDCNYRDPVMVGECHMVSDYSF